MYCSVARILAPALLILCSLLIPVFPEDQGAEGEKLLVKGNQLIQEGRYPEAAEVFSQWKQEAPMDHRAYFFSGMTLAQMGELSAAAADLKEAFHRYPNDPQYKILYANVLTRLGHDDEARQILTSFQNKWNIEPLISGWIFLLVETLNRAGDYEGALRVLDILTQRHPEVAQIDTNRGQIHLNMGNYEKARDYLEKSLEKQPTDNGVAYFSLGKTLLQLGDIKGAKEAYLEAVNQDPDNPEYLWKLGSAYQSLGEHQEAIKYLERAKPAADEFPEIYYVLARSYQAVDRRDEAKESFERFENVSVQNRKEHYSRVEGGELVGRGETALENDDLAGAQRFFELALERDPDNWAAHGYLAEMSLAKGSLYEAYNHLLEMEEIAPDSPSAQFLMARYWYERRDYVRARGYAEKVRKIRPSNSGLRNLLGNIYLALDQIPDAVQEYSKAVELDPERPEFKLNLETAKKRLQSDD